jgi:hypothetical protein
MKQHTPLRKPVGWTGQNASLVMQIDRLFEDVYRLIGNIEKELEEIKEQINESSEDSE